MEIQIVAILGHGPVYDRGGEGIRAGGTANGFYATTSPLDARQAHRSGRIELSVDHSGRSRDAKPRWVSPNAQLYARSSAHGPPSASGPREESSLVIGVEKDLCPI